MSSVYERPPPGPSSLYTGKVFPSSIVARKRREKNPFTLPTTQIRGGTLKKNFGSSPREAPKAGGREKSLLTFFSLLSPLPLLPSVIQFRPPTDRPACSSLFFLPLLSPQFPSSSSPSLWLSFSPSASLFIFACGEAINGSGARFPSPFHAGGNEKRRGVSRRRHVAPSARE